MSLYLRFNYIPAPHTIFKRIFKLKPGTFIRLSIDEKENQVIKTQEYWSLEKEAIRGKEKPFLGSQSETVECLDRLLRNSVKGQMIGDVPIGAFLSGGIDSSSIVALMQDQSSKPINTFSIGFNEKDFKVTLRPHPMFEMKNLNRFKTYVDKNLDLPSLSKYQFLMTDWSGIAIEYSYLTNRPVF